MYERCLNEAERILASDKDVIVPVRKVWIEVSKEAKKQNFEIPQFPDFSAMLEGDPRFEFLPSHQTITEDLEDPLPHEDSPDQTEMEQLGFFSGDRVKLRKADLTPRMLGTILRSKVDRTMDALSKAWELRPEGDQETEGKLLEILARTQKLQQEVKKTFSDKRMTTLEETLRKKKTGSKKKIVRKSGPRKNSIKPVKKRAAGKTGRKNRKGRKG